MNHKKLKIAIILLGHAKIALDIKKIRKVDSDLFEVSEVNGIDYMPKGEDDRRTLNVKYDSNFTDMIKCPDGCDMAVGIMLYKFTDNFFMKRINEKCGVVALHGIEEILAPQKISIETFVLKQIYEMALTRLTCGSLVSQDADNMIHRDTRGCIYDLNGDRGDIIFNTEKPVICNECHAKIQSKQVDQKLISTFEKELKELKKPSIVRIDKFIGSHPLFSMLISIALSLAISPMLQKSASALIAWVRCWFMK